MIRVAFEHGLRVSELVTCKRMAGYSCKLSGL